MAVSSRVTGGRRRLVATVASFSLLASLMVVAPATVLAAASISPFTGGSAISIDTTSAGGTGVYTPLTGPTINTTVAGDIANGATFNIYAPSGFVFNPASAVTATGAGVVAVCTFPGASGLVIACTFGTGNLAGGAVVLAGLQIRPTTTLPSTQVVTIGGTIALPPGSSAGTVTSVPGTATKLGFVAAPTGGFVGQPFPTQPVVAVEDQFGNIQPGTPATVTLSKNAGSPAGTLTCPTSGLVVGTTGGLAGFSGCQFNAVGVGFMLDATAASLTTATSAPFTISTAPVKLLYSVNPGGAPVYGGQPFPNQPVVRSADAGNATVTTDNSTVVTLSIATFVPDVGGAIPVLSCTGGLSKTVVNGIATFAGCSIDKSGTNATIQASSGALTPATSTPAFTVLVGPADHLVFSQIPGPTTPMALAPDPIVQVVDAGGNPVPAPGRLVALTLSTAPLGATLSCDLPIVITSGSGSARFTHCLVNKSGLYSLSAAASGLVSAVSTTFTVAGVADHLTFTTQPLGAVPASPPPNGKGGTTWPIQPVIAIKDASGGTITTDNTTRIRLSIAPGTPGTGGPGTLTCDNGNERVAVAGVVTFAGCKIDKVGTGYMLRADALAPAVITNPTAASLAFNIIVGDPAKLGFQQYPQVGVQLAAGVAWPTLSQPIVAVQDAGGNLVTTSPAYVITLSIAAGANPSGGTLTCDTSLQRTVIAGLAQFTGCKIDKVGTGYKLAATTNVVGGPTAVTGDPFNVTVSPAQITLVTYPSVVTWGTPFTLTIQFASGGATKAFTVQRLSPVDYGQFVNVLSGVTDSTGRAVVQYKPRFNGQYRVVFAGDSTLGAGTSNVTTVNVRSLALLRPNPTGDYTKLSKGTKVTYSATVRPIPGVIAGGSTQVSFVFYQWNGSSWVLRNSRTVNLNSSGVGTLTWTWGSTGKWYVRAVTLPNAYNYIGTSQVERVDVT